MELTIDQALQKGIEAHRAGQVQEADRLYTAIMQAQPKHPDANHNMGVLAVSVGKVQEALPFLKTALEANPAKAQFWLSYIDALIKLERLAEAKAVLDQAKSSEITGEAFDQLEQRLEGVEPSGTSVSQNQDAPEELLQPLINLYRQGQLQQALSDAKQLLEKFPNSITLYNIQGAVLQGLGQLDLSIEAYNKAVAIKPDFAEVYNNIGNVFNEQGKLEEAIEVFSKALSIKPDSAEVYNNLGNVFKEQGKLEEAIEAYNKALAIKSDFAQVYNNMGNALQEQDKLEEAIQTYNRALTSRPDYAEAYNNMGNALTGQGKLEEAIEAYKKALAIKPDYTQAWNNIICSLQSVKLKVSSQEELVSYYPENTGSNYYLIAKANLNYEINLGGTGAESSLNEALIKLSEADNIVVKNPKNSQGSIGSQPQLTDKFVALVHFGRSGTGLLHSLIDGHPEVSTMPSIYLSEYFDHSTWERIISDGWSKMADRFITIYDVLFNAASTVPVQGKSNKLLRNIGREEGMANVGDQRDEVLSVDRTLFSAELQRLMNCYDQLDAFLFFKLVHRAYDKAINDISQKNLIFYHIHNPDTYGQLNFVRSAPKANWVMMVREPVQSCVSWLTRPFQRNEYFDVAAKIRSMLFVIDNIIYHKQNSVGVRLEDLKESPRQTIPALCKWMAIEETESLYEMTAQGKKWWGDPSSPDFEKDGMNPFGQTSIKRKVGAIFSKNDQFILRTLYYPFSVRFGYVEENAEQFEIDLQTIRPMLDEMFDFEKMIAERTQADPEQFMKSGSYLYLRSGLIERWNTLNEHHTYPNMIKRLTIN